MKIQNRFVTGANPFVLCGLFFDTVVAFRRCSLSTAAHVTKSPRQLYNIAKSLGIWDPAKIDLSEDKAQGQHLPVEGRHLVHGMDFLREQLERYPEHVEPVRELFLREAANIPKRTDFVFTPNPLGLDRDKIQQISYANHAQRMREAGLQ